MREERMLMMIFDLVVRFLNLHDRNIELIREVINNNLHSTFDNIIQETFLSNATIERLIYGGLKMKNVTPR